MLLSSKNVSFHTWLSCCSDLQTEFFLLNINCLFFVHWLGDCLRYQRWEGSLPDQTQGGTGRAWGQAHTHTSAQCQGGWGCILHQRNLHPCSVATFTESQTSSREAEMWIWKHYCGECSWSTAAFWDQVEAREVWKARDLLGLKGWKCWEAQD